MRLVASRQFLGLFFTLCIAAFGLGLGACGDEASTPAPTRDGPPVIYTSIEPNAWMARRLVGDLARVVLPVPDGVDPINWQPSVDEIGAYQRADLILLNGAEFEKWALTATLPPSRVVRTAAPFENRFITFATSITHSHGDDEHTHEGVDGHTWLDPVLAIRQSEAVRDAVKRLLPDHADTIDANHRALVEDLRSLDAAFRALGTPPDGEVLVSAHPAYQYLARQYGWTVMDLDVDLSPTAPPSEDTLAQVQEQLSGKKARYLLWGTAPTDGVAKAIETAVGLRSLRVASGALLDDALRAAHGDYLGVMRANVKTLAPAFGR